ncbi:MAG: dockerin type I repeat-containing protein [Firmicutes bacterium]|nr:dockerin type I repeat-containing protein [Bacillota bacterium]
MFDGQLVIRESFPPLADVSRGDVNLDGKVDAADLTVLARHVAGISFLTDPQALSNADVTGEGGISASDLTKLARFVAHIEDEL